MSSQPSRHDPASPRQRDSSRREYRYSQTARQSSGSRQRRPSAGVDDPQYPTNHHRPRRTSSGNRGDRDTSRDVPGTRYRRPSSGQRHSSTRVEPRSQRPKPEPGVSVRPMVSPSAQGGQYRDPTPRANAPLTGQSGDIRRQKSLVRPERRRHEPGDPDYYYSKHAQNMNVMPSTTGRDPQVEEDFDAAASSDSATLKGSMPDTSPSNEKFATKGGAVIRTSSQRQPNKLGRKSTKAAREEQIKEERRQKIQEASGTPSLWLVYCHVVTFWCPNIVLSLFGKRQKEEQRAWREKMGLISIILLFMLFVGFLTFGFTETVCPAGGGLRLRINHVEDGYMIFHGSAYDLTRSAHPLARGIPKDGNVLFDTSPPGGGKDGSFLFQNVNGACKGLIKPVPGSDVPTNNTADDLAWYFPCNLYTQDGSTLLDWTIPTYFGYACHAQDWPRRQFYGLQATGAVYFTWDDIKNSSRNLIVYSGDVLDLNLLQWVNKSQVAYPSKFDDLRLDPNVRGKDLTMALSSSENKQMAKCFQEIIKVGNVDTDTVGCIASKVVLYVSLIFILGIVVIKFSLALIFNWFICGKYAASKTSMTGGDSKSRKDQIEDWTDDIYRPPPKITDPANIAGDRVPKRGSFLPATSRFTSPYAIERGMTKNRAPPTTMTSQQSSVRMYGSTNRSEIHSTYLDGKPSVSESRTSLMESNALSSSQRYSSMMHTEADITGPEGFIHESVVPQPPLEWQPFGFPLAHTICLVTAYSEGPEGIRTTLDSIAMTDYPNSHKLIFVICDGLIKGKGESMSTPNVCVGMMKDHAVPPDQVQPFSYVAVASGSKRHNMAKIYAGFYDYGADSVIPVERQQRVPMVVVVKCGTPAEAKASKPGNRGKRDSQIILMSFLQKVMFDERMTELEYEMFNGIWKITGISPDFYEIVLCVDADTKVFPDSVTHMVSAMVKDPEIMGLCGETKIANKTQSWVTMIQVFEYFISHHQAKAFESFFGGVTCLPGCFCMYRIKTPKGGQNYWVPILANPDIVEHYSENVVDTLHKKNLLLLGEDRYLSSLMLRTFPQRKMMFIPQAVCKTTVPDEFKVLLSQRRRWINSTVHNLMELVLVRDLCGTFCFSMQFVVFIDLVSTLVLPGAIAFTIYIIALGIKAAITHTAAPVIPLVLLALILGLPGVLIVITAHKVIYVAWMIIYLFSLPVWNFILPVYSFWHFDDFSWGDTRQAAGEVKGGDKSGHGGDGEFDSSKITMKRWGDFEQERRLRTPAWGSRIAGYQSIGGSGDSPVPRPSSTFPGSHHERKVSNLIL